jgi:N-acetylmuramoyl-L-alanine amidase
MRDIKQIIIHCADTYADMDIGAETIRGWHVDGNGWSDIGYHYVIKRDGIVEKGRAEEVIGAHARGMNGTSIGICLVGGKSRGDDGPEDNFTEAQFDALDDLCTTMQFAYPEAKIMGHCDVPDSGKTCPNFDLDTWLENR